MKQKRIVGNVINYPLSKKVTLLQAIIILYQATLNGKDYKAVKVPEELYDYAIGLYELKGFDTELVTVDLKVIPCDFKKDKDLTIYLYTGGKDSLASWLKYKDDTKKAKLFHVHGLNQLYPLEVAMVEKHRDLLNHEVDICDIKLPQLKNQIEHPVKNLLTYALALDYYKTIPERFSFGYISFEGATTSETEEELEEDETDALIQEALFEHGLVDTIEKVGSPQVSEVLGDGENLSALALGVLGKYIGSIPQVTEGMETTVATFKIIDENNLSQKLSSCMSLTAHRDHNRKTQNRLYSLEVEGKQLVAGSAVYAITPPIPDTIENNTEWFRGHKKSIWDLERFFSTEIPVYILNYRTGVIEQIADFSEVKLDHIYKPDYIGEYECAVCFKCAERYIINAKHLDYKYNQKFLDNAYKLLLKSMVNLENINNIDFTYYLRKELKVDEKLLWYLWKEADKKNRITQSVYDEIYDMIQEF